MKIEFTDVEKQILRYADDLCTCEAYHNHTCMKCKKIAAGYMVDNRAVIAHLTAMGVVYYHSYHGLCLTAVGKTYLELVR